MSYRGLTVLVMASVLFASGCSTKPLRGHQVSLANAAELHGHLSELASRFESLAPPTHRSGAEGAPNAVRTIIVQPYVRCGKSLV